MSRSGMEATGVIDTHSPAGPARRAPGRRGRPGPAESPRPVVFWVALGALLAVMVGIQIERDRRYEVPRPAESLLYVPSGAVLDRLALCYDALLADVYWIRAIQHYGGTKLSKAAGKRYDLLYPLLDITTTLDPRFHVAYRFGAIFLTEAYPNGPGRPDQAIALLEKGYRHMPEKWQYLMDIGFIYYWWLHDYAAAAEWFRRAAGVPGASWWLGPLAATTLAQGGHRAGSRALWQEIYRSADNQWLRNDAARRLAQLDALDALDRLEAIAGDYARRTGRRAASWEMLVRGGDLTGAPRDPAGVPYVLDPATGDIGLDPASPLFPLPAEPPPAPPVTP